MNLQYPQYQIQVFPSQCSWLGVINFPFKSRGNESYSFTPSANSPNSSTCEGRRSICGEPITLTELTSVASSLSTLWGPESNYLRDAQVIPLNLMSCSPLLPLPLMHSPHLMTPLY